MLYGDADIIAIDSLYSNEIERSFEEMRLSVDEIWPKMTLSPVCLFRFNGPAYLYNHPDPPSGFKKITDKLYVGKQEDLQLFGPRAAAGSSGWPTRAPTLRPASPGAATDTGSTPAAGPWPRC